MQRIFLILCLILFSVGAHAKRLALVIGNDSYQNVPTLKNARADARAVARSLEGQGFQVTLKTDLDERAFFGALRDLRRNVQGGDDIVFYFAGHGVQISGGNYLLPTDIASDTEDQVKDESIPLQRLLEDLQEQKARFTLAIVDACRDNPFKGKGRSIGGRGLQPVNPATGQMVLYSAGAGQQALDRLNDNDRDPNGLFTRILLKEIDRPGLSADRMLRKVRDQVVHLAKAVGHDQVPALYDQTIGEFYFKQGKPEPGPRDLLPDTHQAPATTLASINPNPPMPSQGGLSLDDIEQQQAIRDKWTAWQTRMQSDYDKVLGLNAAHELKIQAWDRFLATYKDDNPFSEQDHKLREQAQQNKKQTDTTKREPKHAQPLRPPQTFSVPVPRVSSSELSRLNFQDQIAEYDRLAGSLESTRPSDRAASSRGVWKDGGGEGDRASSLAAACNACHGRNGMSAGAIPSLAGLEQRYFVDQLKAFRDGSRPSTIMSKYASGYTDAEFVAMGKYYSSIKY